MAADVGCEHSRIHPWGLLEEHQAGGVATGTRWEAAFPQNKLFAVYPGAPQNGDTLVQTQSWERMNKGSRTQRKSLAPRKAGVI